jgi:hypothetical protein
MFPACTYLVYFGVTIQSHRDFGVISAINYKDF